MRYEHKYLVPEHLHDALRRAVEPYVGPDPQLGPGRRTYTVRNIYFDDAAFKAYFEKNDGVEVRAKPRLRCYDSAVPGASVFLEVKRRHGAVGSKDRAAMQFHDLPALLASGDVARYVDPRPDHQAAARKFLFHINRDTLRPVLFETYEREPYVGVIEPSLRVTFDRQVRSSLFPDIRELFDLKGMKRSFKRSIILEVKYDAAFGFPRWLDTFISRHTVIREALSKYWMCITDWGVVTPTARARVHASADWQAMAGRGY
ncbi:MAG: polyphosphate polymerase domain-containing protein [Acidobacteriota bacterium]